MSMYISFFSILNDIKNVFKAFLDSRVFSPYSSSLSPKYIYHFPEIRLLTNRKL